MSKDNTKHGVKTLNRSMVGHRGTMFRVPNPASEFDTSVTSDDRQAALKEYCQNCKQQYQDALTHCVATAGA